LVLFFYLGACILGPLTESWIMTWRKYYNREGVVERMQAAHIFRAKHYPKHYKANFPPPGQ
jgi:hypothetical protein